MKKLLALTAVFFFVFTIAGSAALFSDVNGHWAEPYIEALTMEGVINGVSDNSFAPDSSVTREQFLKMLMIVSAKSTGERMLFENPPKSDEGELSPFADVSADRWSYYYIKKAYGTIIYTEEYGEKFEPVKYITREEAAVWMSRALELSPAEPDFTDNDLIGKKELVGAAAASGLISGFPDKSFRPGHTLTRGEASVMLLRAGRINAMLVSASYTETAKEFTRDLYLDGTEENVKITVDGESYAVTVNDITVLGGRCETAASRYYVIDIDKNDSFKEIAVVEKDFGDSTLAIYRYTGKTLYLMGTVDSVGDIAVRTDSTPIGDDWGAVSINMDGSITANIGVQFVHTMLIRRQFKLNSKMRIEPVGTEFYTIGKYSSFTVKNDLESSYSDEEHPNISLKPGYTGSIVKTDLKNWIYIETGSGDKGWIYVNEGLVNGLSLSDYLDGLNYAG